MIKRAFDLLASGLGILLLSPLLGVIAVLVRLDSQGPVLFRQERVGKSGRPFQILKFRTMRVDAERVGGQLTVRNDPRITGIGRFLRKAKLDELPQLMNVFRGDMSLVGPRPEVPRYVAMYTPEQRRVLEVPPGITDLASIEFRDENEFLQDHDDPETFYVTQIMPKKLELNLLYLSRRSFVFDLFIIFRTLWRVLLPRQHGGNKSGLAAEFLQKQRGQE